MADVGDLVPSTKGGWVLVAPTHCPNGHELSPNRCLVGHAPCSCGGHTTWWCREPGCGATVYGPSLRESCAVLNGPAARI